MILAKDDFLNAIKTRLGDDTSDEAIKFLEDVTDTYNDLETKSTSGSDEEWLKKYDELDKSWRDKYKARFFEGGTSKEEVKDEQKKDVRDDGEEKSFDDLFVEREG